VPGKEGDGQWGTARLVRRVRPVLLALLIVAMASLLLSTGASADYWPHAPLVP
jgi:hypothetical protein